MPTRLIIAYSLIALLVVAAAAWIGWLVYHSPRRVDERRRARTLEEHREREERDARRATDDSAAVQQTVRR